jgi:hypothetical protein
MSVSKILKFKDDGLEFTIEIRNQEFELSLQLEKQIEVAGYPNILIKPMVYCKATNDNASSSVEVPYEIFPVDLEEQRKKLENEISVLVEEGKKEREEIQKRQEELKNELDELTKYDEEQQHEGVEEEVKEEVKEDNVEVKEEKLIEEEETAEEEVTEEAKEEVTEEAKEEEEVVKNQEEIIQEEVTNGLEIILERFGNRLERIINKLEVIENKQQKHHHHHAVDVEIVEPVVEKPHRPLTPHPPPAKPQPPTTPAKPHPPTTPAPHPPTTPVAKPHPPATPAPHPPAETLTEKKTHKPLNFEIMNLHNKYSSENIENNLVDVIIDHMKCVDTYHISGKEKKEMVLNSIDTLLSTNEMRSDNKKILRNLSSKLIDTFYSLDKHKINISEKLPTTFSCFPR